MAFTEATHYARGRVESTRVLAVRVVGRQTAARSSKKPDGLSFRVLGTRCGENVRQAVVALVAGVFERLLAVVHLRQIHRKRPGPGPRVRIVESDRPLDGVCRDRREPLGHLQVLARSAIRGLVREIRRLYDQRAPLEVTAGIAEIFANLLAD